MKNKDKKRDSTPVPLTLFRWRRMVILATSLFAYLLVFFQRTSLNVLQAELQTEFALSALQFSSLSAVYFYLYAFLQIPSGILVDFMGSRKTSAGGLLIAGAGSLMMAMAPNYSWLMTGRILSTIGVAPVFVNTLKLNSEWFKPKEFMTLTGITLFVGNAGALLASYPLSWISYHSGWRMVFACIAIITILVSFFAYYIVRDKPSDLGFKDHVLPAEPLSLKQTMEGFFFLLRKNRIYFPISIFCFAFISLQTFQSAWGARFSQTMLGIDSISAGFVVMWISIGVMFGALIGGKCADRFGRIFVMNIYLGALALVWTLLLWSVNASPTMGNLSLWMFLMGFFGSGFSITWSLGKEIAGRKYSGIGMALVNGSGFLVAAIVQLIYGGILDRYRINDQYMLQGFQFGNWILIFSALLSFFLSIFYTLKLKQKINLR